MLARFSLCVDRLQECRVDVVPVQSSPVRVGVECACRREVVLPDDRHVHWPSLVAAGGASLGAECPWRRGARAPAGGCPAGWWSRPLSIVGCHWWFQSRRGTSGVAWSARAGGRLSCRMTSASMVHPRLWPERPSPLMGGGLHIRGIDLFPRNFCCSGCYGLLLKRKKDDMKIFSVLVV